jgi:KUP system potassium uptake protein
VDTTFFAANLTNVLEGGYVPLILAGLVYLMRVVWHVGAASVSMRLQEAAMPVGEFMKKSRRALFRECRHGRVSDTDATRCTAGDGLAPQAQSRAASSLVCSNCRHATGPVGQECRSVTVAEIAPNFWRATARYGFMERPNIPALLRQAHDAEHCMVET